jgi:soluble P-type ATPase
MAPKVLFAIALGGTMTKHVRGLIGALRLALNEAILESNEVAAIMEALKLTGKCPVFTIDISLQEAPGPDDQPSSLKNAGGVALGDALGDELVLSDADVAFLTVLGISDPSWCSGTPNPVPHSTE